MVRQGRGRWLTAGAAGIALALAGCGKKPVATAPLPVSANQAPGSGAAAPAATPGLNPARRLALAAGLLDQGKEAQARAELTQLLAEKPDEERAADLLKQIDTDPRALYGPDSFAYRLQGKENLVDAAQRFLGSRYRFWGLAKFNNISVPQEVKPGQTVMIPGKPRNLEPVAPSTPSRRPARPASRGEGAAPASGPAPAARPTVDRGRAQQLRRAGLEQLSAGSIDRAVALLGQASAADPGNGAIRNDLARAQRIQSAVRR